ncbi:site-specific DNA-methyltransferase [Kocuria rosea]|uniref:site-specific DNA-methyltransferase n=1 Tax=Kocuria rosea TaxID=1275 RepID=UPI00203E868A|nr:site-specific DNA-methyltransferase [Kocuria rosea]
MQLQEYDDVPNQAPRLELTWPGKDQFLLVPRDEAGKPVWVDRDHPAASEVRLTDFTGAVGNVDDSSPHSDNLLFTGDSLDVLRILSDSPEFRREYRGKVRLVYIDPPFNTGQTFEHYDDWMEHSTWLSFMHERLLLIRDVLAPNGTVWLHLDNFEIHRMRVVMDEIFGADNFINAAVWRRTTAKSAAKRGMGTMYDSILVYGRSEAASLNPTLLPYSEEYIAAKYTKYDEKGRYQAGDLTAPGTRTGDSGQPWRGHDPGSRKRHWAAPQIDGFMDTEWPAMSTRERLDALWEAGYIQAPSKPGSAPRYKRYLKHTGGVAMGDLWADVSVINSQAIERTGYDTQKPEQLLERVINMATDPGDVVMDTFVGSGTTVAVAHKLGRRWVAADILPATVNEYVVPRLRSVVQGTELSGITKAIGWNGGGGFRTVQVSPSMYEQTPFGVMLADWATNGRFSRAVAGQLGFVWQADAAPFCGVRGRMRLAVFDGAVGSEEIRHVVAALEEKERVTVVAKSVLPGAEALLSELSKGSRIRKAPRDLLTAGAARARRRVEGGRA